MKHSTKQILSTMVVTGGLLIVSAHAGGFSWSVGPLYRHGMQADVRGTSHAQDLGMGLEQVIHVDAPPSVLGTRGQYNPGSSAGALSTTGYGDRSFDDGFVFMDAGTGVPASLAPDHTWYWGYTDASQYDASAATLTFHQDISLSRAGQIQDTGREVDVSLRTLQSSEWDASRDVNGWGLEAVGAWCLGGSERCAFSLQLGLNGIAGEKERFSEQTLHQEVTRREVDVVTTHQFVDTYQAMDTYVYALSPPIIPPPAPYSGTYAGAPGSPLIPNVPSTRTRSGENVQRNVTTTEERTLVLTEILDGYNQIDAELESSVYQLWMGLETRLLGERIALSITPRLSLNLVELDVERNESYWLGLPGRAPTSSAQWHDSESTSQLVFGLGAFATLGVASESGWFARAVCGYDWITDDVALQAGPNEFTFDASGFTAALHVGRQL